MMILMISVAVRFASDVDRFVEECSVRFYLLSSTNMTWVIKNNKSPVTMNHELTPSVLLYWYLARIMPDLNFSDTNLLHIYLGIILPPPS